MSAQIEIVSGNNNETLSALYAKPVEVTSIDRRKTLIIMAHDFPGGSKDAHDDFYGDLEFLFSHLGFHTIRFDFKGCGDSDGQERGISLSTAMEDFASVLNWAAQKKFEHLIYVAEGLGAAIALQNMQKNVRLMLLFWPALDLPALAQERFGDDRDHKASTSLIAQLKEADLGPYIARADIPTLIQHGAQDDVIPITHTDFLKKHTKARRLDVTSYQDGGHGLLEDRHRKMVFYHVGQFLEKYT